VRRATALSDVLIHAPVDARADLCDTKDRLMRRLRTFLLAASVGLSGIAGTPHAHAQPSTVPGKEHAKKLFEEGVDLEKKADYAGALAKYKEAEQITATPGLRFHKGYCLEMTGKLAAALDEYENADRMARDQNKQEVHAAVVARLDPLRGRAPQIAIRLATPAKDAEVQLDGVAVGAPLLDGKAFRLDPGEHTVTARAGGYRAFSRKVQVPENVTTSVDISLERVTTGGPLTAPAPAPAREPAPAPAREPAPAPAREPAAQASVTEPPSEAPHGRSLGLPIATTAGAVAFAGLGVAMFLVAGSAQSDAQAACPKQPTCDSEQTKVRTFDALALTGFIGAAGLGVLSVVLWTSKGPESHGARPSARVVATPSALGLAGTF
jgi:hypothetical protein